MSGIAVERAGFGNAAAQRLVGLGVVLWAVGVVTVRALAPAGVFTGVLTWFVLPATVPLAWVTLRLACRVAGQPTAVVHVAALVSAPALMLDGLAFSWAPWLYGAAEDARRAAAGWLLWFVGVSLPLAFWQAARQARRA